CTVTCDACEPGTSGEGEITPCSPSAPPDTWRFNVVAGQTVRVHVDTVDASTAAVLGIVIEGPKGQTPGFAFPRFPCSSYFAAPLCPLASFTAVSDSSCDAQLGVFSFPRGGAMCADITRARYRISVTGSGLVLVADDVPGFLSAAFLPMPGVSE